MKIFIDDERMPLACEIGDWIIVRDPRTACALIRANAHFVTHLSFDNDLGFEMEGRHILQQIVGTLELSPIVLPMLKEIRIRSANIVANQAMFNLAVNARSAGVLRSSVSIVQRSALNEAYLPATLTPPMTKRRPGCANRQTKDKP